MLDRSPVEPSEDIFPILSTPKYTDELQVLLSHFLMELQFIKNELKSLQKRLDNVLHDDLK